MTKNGSVLRQPFHSNHLKTNDDVQR